MATLDTPLHADLPPAVADSGLGSPWLRPGLVLREKLLTRLVASPAPIVTVVAPSGYGKTTLLAQLDGCAEQRSAWVSLELSDNDPVAFLGHLTSALDALTPGEPPTFGPLVSASMPPVTTVTFRIAPALLSLADALTVVFDHLEMVENAECLDAVVALAAHLPPRWRLAIASRMEPPLPLARLRAEGRLVEIGAADLAMDDDDARALLAAEDVELDDADVATLVQRTEGWPVGLYLAALALKAQGRRATAGVAFRGDDRLLADYLRSEVLARLPPNTVSFLTRTSIVDRMSGPLCDAVLAARGSSDVLESLERSNLLVVPLDRVRQSYRYHHLFQELLRAELTRTEPESVPELHLRAAAWFEANGRPDLALRHAQAAGDADRAARLLTALAHLTYAAGRVDTVRRWLAWFEERGLINQYPQIAVHGSWLEASLGRPAAAERWGAAAEHGSLEEKLPDGSTLESYLAANRASLCAKGVAQMRADAQFARDHLAPGSPMLGATLALEAMSHFLDGDLDAADAGWTHAFDVASYLGEIPTAALAAAQRAVIAIERRDPSTARSLSASALGIVEAGRLEDYYHAAVVFAVAARLDVRRGDLAQARTSVTRAARLRPLLTYAIPWSAVFLVQLGHAYLELADPTGARAVLREVRDILRVRTQLGTVTQQADELQQQIDTIRQQTVRASAMTAAELRIVPLLATHLSFREIGERVHVSRHTVKSQAIAIYRKLGVSSRSEAIERVHAIGLLGSLSTDVSLGG